MVDEQSLVCRPRVIHVSPDDVKPEGQHRYVRATVGGEERIFRTEITGVHVWGDNDPVEWAGWPAYTSAVPPFWYSDRQSDFASFDRRAREVQGDG